VACDLLCVSASSTPSERLFSQSGLLSGHLFSQTTPKNLEYRVLAKLNMKKECNSFIFYLVVIKSKELITKSYERIKLRSRSFEQSRSVTFCYGSGSGIVVDLHHCFTHIRSEFVLFLQWLTR
jgi:hypothetical protein